MADNSNIDDAQAYQQPPEPSPDLKSLGRLVGTWNVSSPEILGRITFEWMKDGFFLIQRIDFDHAGRRVKGIEIIGHERRFGAEPSEEIKSRVYSNSGDTLDYGYELEGDTLTIWAGQGEGLPGVLQGHIQRRRRHPHRRLALLRGGGYEATPTRIEQTGQDAVS